MGLFTAIGGLFTSSPDKVMDAAKGVGNFIDESFYSDQEKAEANLKLLEHQLKWLDATQGMNRARRVLAFAFAGTFLFTFLLCAIAVCVGYGFDYDTAPFVDRIILLASEFKIGWATITILSFYFIHRLTNGTK